jgi:hypothetical protein
MRQIGAVRRIFDRPRVSVQGGVVTESTCVIRPHLESCLRLAIPSYISPMLLQPTRTLPRGKRWLYELKFDGYRGVAVKEGSRVRLWSRNNIDLSRRFPRIVAAVAALPCANVVLDGEIVCLDPDGKPCFEELQHFSPKRERFLFYYAFDLMWLDGQDLRGPAAHGAQGAGRCPGSPAARPLCASPKPSTRTPPISSPSPALIN